MLKPHLRCLAILFLCTAVSTSVEAAPTANQKDVYDKRFLQELDSSGIVKELYAGK